MGVYEGEVATHGIHLFSQEGGEEGVISKITKDGIPCEIMIILKPSHKGIACSTFCLSKGKLGSADEMEIKDQNPWKCNDITILDLPDNQTQSL